MRAAFRTIAIVGAAQSDGLMVGVGQVRQFADAKQTRLIQDGVVAIVVTDASGRRCDIMLSPEEAMLVGPQLCAAAAVAAAALPPILSVAEERPPRIIQ